MLSNRPYLLRAFYQWIVDSACTPIMVLDATHPRCQIPRDFAEGGEIVFNVSSSAVRDFNILNEKVEFKASFSSVIHLISAPINAVMAVYAEENGEGLFFDADDDNEEDEGEIGVENNLVELDSSVIAMKNIDTSSPKVEEQIAKGKPFLRLVE